MSNTEEVQGRVKLPAGKAGVVCERGKSKWQQDRESHSGSRRQEVQHPSLASLPSCFLLGMLETVAKHLRNGWIFVIISQQNGCFSDIHTKINKRYVLWMSWAMVSPLNVLFSLHGGCTRVHVNIPGTHICPCKQTGMEAWGCFGTSFYWIHFV